MSNVLFVVPPTIDYDKFVHPPDNVRTVSRKGGHYGSALTDMPLGVLALSAYVKKYAGAQTKLVDFNVVLNKLDSFQHGSFTEFFFSVLSSREFLEFTPDVIGISALFTTSYQNMLDIASCCRSVFPKALILAGGGVPTNMPRDIFRDSTCVDALCYGEGERALAGLLVAPDKGRYLDECPSFTTRQKIETGKTLSLDFIEDLDEIPWYDYDILDVDDYRLNPTIAAYPGVDSTRKHITIMTSRGCPHHCCFCSAHSVHGRKMRYYSIPRIRESIRQTVERYGTQTIIFQDDHFMARKERAHEILSLLREFNLKAFFPNSLALYALDRKMIEALKSAGVSLLVLAVESGSHRVLREIMHKPLDLSIVRRVVADCRELGIDTDANIIIGLPGETKQDIEDARAFLKTLYATWFRIYVAVPLVGSEMHEICIKKNYLKNGHIKGDFKKAVIETEDFTSEYIQKTAYELNLDLNFVENGDFRLGNYARALKEFENTIKVKNDHAFAYYFAARCHKMLKNHEEYIQYKGMYEDILGQSPFWKGYADHFRLAPLD